MKSSLQNIIAIALEKMQVGNAENFLHLEIPEKSKHGDFASNAAMQLVKILKKNPRQIAEEIIQNLPENEIIEKTEIAGPGFLNFFVNDDFVLKNFLAFEPQKKLENKNSKKICIDASHPNIAKPLHVGHLRSAIIGDSVSRILKYSGNEVLLDNFLGDWGTNFGKLVVAIEKWGDMKEIEKAPIAELVKLYKKFVAEAAENPALDDEGREAFRKLEVENDKKIREKWLWIREVSLVELQKFYDFLGVHFDLIQGESFYVQFTQETLEKIEKIGEISEGALVVKFLENPPHPSPLPPEGEGASREKMPTMLFRKSDGSSFYQTRDVSRILYYDTKDFDELLYFVGGEQSLHFAQIFETAKMLGSQSKCEHIAYGLILGSDGKKFSTRKGNGVGLEEVFDEAKEKIRGIISERVAELSEAEKEKLVEEIAIGAIKFNDLSQNRLTDIVFNWEKILSFEGFSGPFLQYSHARAKSILRKLPLDKGGWGDFYNSKFKIQNLKLDTELPLLKKILEFADIVRIAGETRRPNILAEYLFQLCKNFNGFYQNTPILKAETEEIKKFRLMMVEKFAQTLHKGLYLLGMHAPEKM